MSKILESTLLEKYKTIHKRESIEETLLPKDARIAELFLMKFIEGPESVFAELKATQPISYGSLVTCNDLWLLENKTSRGKSLFTMAVVFDGHIITSQMLNKRYIEQRVKNEEVIPSSMACLNSEFHCYYSLFNGLNSPKNNNPKGLKNYRLPDSLGSWLEISEFCKEYTVDKSIFDNVQRSCSDSLLVWISNHDGELFLITDSTYSSDIFRMNYKISDKFVKLSDPVEEVDEYCSSVIMGAQ